MIAIRAAVRVEGNDRDAIFRGTQRLLREIAERNALEEEDVVSAFFTMTPDLDAEFPAHAAREMGWTGTAMLGAQETAVPGAMDRMIRVLVHAETEEPARHVYLGEAAAMRPDLAEEGDARRASPEPAAGPRDLGRLLVVGLGLIGGSAALALRRRGLFDEVVGHDVSEVARRRAVRAGAVAEAVADPEDEIGRADVVLLAVPVDEVTRWLARRGGRLRRGAVVVDVGSTKRGVVRAMEAHLPPGVEAVGAHPMAGSEESGMAAARADLFRGATWALVATNRTGERARTVAEAIVDAVGGRRLWVDAETHDRAAASTSHLPYVVAAALALHLDARAGERPIRELAGPGARDMIRLAGSDPGVMSGIVETNWPEVRGELERFAGRLDELAGEISAAVSGRSAAGDSGSDRAEGRPGAAREPGAGPGDVDGRPPGARTGEDAGPGGECGDGGGRAGGGAQARGRLRELLRAARAARSRLLDDGAPPRTGGDAGEGGRDEP